MASRKKAFYSYAEAQVAVQRLAIKNMLEYRARYREDKRLPSSPHKIYADAGWSHSYDFFGTEKPDLYPTYAEAQAAVQRLGIKGMSEYQGRYREDIRLPSNPNQTYATAGWTDRYDFFSTEKPDLYPSYAEAQAAVQRLGIKSVPEYLARYWEDKRLPSNPDKTYAAAGWADSYDFFGTEKPDLYPTYAEAKAAVQRLGIKGMSEYLARYWEDKRLPSNPHKIYADAGWTDRYDYLGTEKPDLYPTYAEAQAAVQRLGIKGVPEYLARYREDIRLPSNPNQTYANTGWTYWFAFFGTDKHDLYPTYAEAQAAVQRLGIKNFQEYLARYWEDKRLPSDPYRIYASAGWTDRYDFFGTEKPNLYPTYAEAQAAVQRLGIKGMPEYQARYREDIRLPSNPDKTYAAAGWTDSYDYLGNESPYDVIADYPRVWNDLNRWLKTQTGISTKKAALRALLTGFYQKHAFPDDSKFLLLRANLFNADAYQQFIEDQAESLKRPYHSAIAAFYQWVLDEDCTDVDADERIVLPEYRNPFVTVLAGFADSLQAYRPNQSTKTPLGYEYILRGRNFLVPNGEQVLLTQPSLQDLPHLQEFFDSRLDWIYVDESVIDRSDPNCIWRFIKNADRTFDGKRQIMDSYQLWSPVRFVALYTLLRFPLRGQQILWLDSGEADKEIAVLDAANGSIRWQENKGPLVGKGSKKHRPQAVVQRGSGDAPKILVTTNKTGRKEGGYEIDWIPDDLVYWFLRLRDWQAKYNPLTEPTEWSKISLRAETNEKILKARGTQCFLFRIDNSGQPLQTTSAFPLPLNTLLYKIQRDGENLAIENLDRRLNSQRYLSPYTPHSLRVSLITAFIADGDAPIHLISKLVGHASLVMTIYYTKLNNEQMRRGMREAEKRAALLVTDRQAETIRTQGLTPLRNQLIATDGNRSLLDSDVPNSACIVFDHGICPMSAASCHIGGELVVERKLESLYGPVEAGYLGKKNCPRCRFFVTGVPFLGGLVALANELALEIHDESGRFQKYQAEVEALEQELYDACQANKPDMQSSQRKQATAYQQQSAAKLDGLLTDYSAINRYVQGCLKLINAGDQGGACESGVRLITGGDLHKVALEFEESNTQYHLLAEICQNATIYKSINPSRAVPLISQAIDLMAANNNLAPAMFRLNDEQKLVVINELNRLLLQRLGSWEKIDDLFSGDLMLQDIDAYDPQLERISIEIKKVLSSGTSRQLTHANEYEVSYE